MTEAEIAWLRERQATIVRAIDERNEDVSALMVAAGA